MLLLADSRVTTVRFLTFVSTIFKYLTVNSTSIVVIPYYPSKTQQRYTIIAEFAALSAFWSVPPHSSYHDVNTSPRPPLEALLGVSESRQVSEVGEETAHMVSQESIGGHMTNRHKE